MICPALTCLEEIDHAAVAAEGSRKLCSITDAGCAHLDANRDQVTLTLDGLARVGGRMSQVREAFAGLGDADPQAADELHQARHALGHASATLRAFLRGRYPCEPCPRSWSSRS